MPKRRANKEGTLRLCKDGRYEKRVYLGTKVKSVYGKTQREALQKAKALERDYAAGRIVAGGSTIVSALFERWLELKATEVEPRTLNNYRSDYERYIRPYLGGRKIDVTVLTTREVRDYQLELAQKHGAYTANRARSLLGNALGDAVAEGELPYNVAAPVKGVKHEKKRIEIWSASEIDRVLLVAQENKNRYYPMIFVALTTGLRHAEITGLRWSRVMLHPVESLSDVDEHGELHIDTSVVEGGVRKLSRPKTPYSVRNVGFDLETRQVLEAHMHIQGLERSRYAKDLDLVFPTGNGTILDGTNTATMMKRLCARAEVKPLTFHGLRHTHASMLIASVYDPVKVARRLGHASPGFTLKEYSHFFEKQQRDPVPTFSKMLGRPVIE